jgi:16S rRNA (uracil1498-N3)-methyltransferase
VFVADLDASTITLDPVDDHHLRRVLRVRPGESVTATDGHGRWRWCALAPGGLEAVGAVVVTDPPTPPITVAFALVKGDRPEWIVQKLTELGVDRIVPFESARTVVRWRGTAKEDHHVARLRKVAREAAMQSRRFVLPEVTTVRAVAEVLADPAIAAAEPGGERPTAAITAVAIGPEGGFTSAELALVSHRIALPGGVLRTETAAIAAGVLLASARTTG